MMIGQCYIADNTYISPTQICHEVMCRQGQVMTGNRGSRECQMDSTEWVTGSSNFVMWLLLDFDQDIAINDAVLKRHLTRNLVQHPWQALWKIETFYRPFARNIDMTYANGGNDNMTNVQKSTYSNMRLS